MSTGYDELLWLKSSRGSALGVYLWRDRAILRQTKTPYREQVVACDVDAADLLDEVQGL